MADAGGDGSDNGAHVPVSATMRRRLNSQKAHHGNGRFISLQFVLYCCVQSHIRLLVMRLQNRFTISANASSDFYLSIHAVTSRSTESTIRASTTEPRGNAILTTLERDVTKQALVSVLTKTDAPRSEFVQPLHDYLHSASSSFRSLAPQVYTETYRTMPWGTRNAACQTPSDAIFNFEMKYGENLKDTTVVIPDQPLPNGWLHTSVSMCLKL